MDKTNYMKSRQRMTKGERIRSDLQIAMTQQITSPFGRTNNNGFDKLQSPFNTQVNFANYSSVTPKEPFIPD